MHVYSRCVFLHYLWVCPPPCAACHGSMSPSAPAGLPDVRERTLIAVKPDGVQRRLIGRIIQRFEQRGFKLVGLKMLQVTDVWDHVFGDGRVTSRLFTVCVVSSGFWGPPVSALLSTDEEAFLPRSARLHDLGSCGCHGEASSLLPPCVNLISTFALSHTQSLNELIYVR